VILDSSRLVEDGAYRKDVRHRFLTDHFFAAELAGFHDFYERAHRPAVNLYFPKNPNLPIKDQHPKKMRLHLDPRKTFKTTLNLIDSLQWIAAFPEEITILNESATQKLAMGISNETARYFYCREDAPKTLLQLAFPELVTEKLPRAPWNVPNRRETGSGALDFTIDYTSPESTQSGWHPLIMKSDDVEDTLNSGIDATQETRQAVINKCDQNENLLRRGGYRFITGTRYHPFDWYANCLKRTEKNPENWEVLVRCSVKMKDGSRIVPGEFPAEEDVILQFPEFEDLSYKALKEIYDNNFESFACQQQNDPMGGSVSWFPPELYGACEISQDKIPLLGERTICWRPRYTGKKCMAEYSEGVVATIRDDKVIVIDAAQGAYTPSREAEKIMRLVKQHEARGVMIVATPGSDYLGAHIRNEAARQNRGCQIQWLDFEEDDYRRAAKMQQLEPLGKVGRLLFSTGMSKGQECRKQFVHFGLVEENGLVECVSHLAEMVPISLLRANMSEEEIEMQRRRRHDALIGAFLNQQGMNSLDEEARLKTEAHLAAMEAAMTRTWGMPPMPGGLDG
jgi:hypothetical protein